MMDDHELLVRIDERVGAIHKRLDEQDERMDMKDAECIIHLARTQELEAWKNRIIWMTIGAGAVAGAVATFVYSILTRFLFRG